MATKKDDLVGKVEKWLDKQGYPLEMEVGRCFRASGFRVVLSEYYVDPETEQPREIDCFATKQKGIDKATVQISFAVECKKSTDKPWVTLCSAESKLAAPARVSQRPASKLGHQLLRCICHTKEIQGLPIFQLTGPYGYSVVRALGGDNEDKAYGAIMSACNAALASVLKTDKLMKRSGIGNYCHIVFPVVVIDGRLFTAVLEEEGVAIEEVERSTVLWRNPVTRSVHSIINIVTHAGLPGFVSEMSSSVSKLTKHCETDLATQFNTLHFTAAKS